MGLGAIVLFTHGRHEGERKAEGVGAPSSLPLFALPRMLSFSPSSLSLSGVISGTGVVAVVALDLRALFLSVRGYLVPAV